MKGPQRMLAATAAAALLIVAAPPTSAEETPTVVASTPYTDLTPAASADHLAWATTRPKQQPLWVQPIDGDRFRVNATDTWAIKPEIEGTLLAYTESSMEEFQPDIRFFDLETRSFLEPPAGVNTSDHGEWWPAIDGDLLLFSREDPETSYEELLLLDMSTGESQVLASSSGGRRYFTPGGIAGGLAVWSRHSFDFKTGRFIACDVYVHDLATGATTMLDNPGPRCQFGATVDAQGTVYYGRSGFTCGHHAQLLAVLPGGEPTVLIAFDDGEDFFTAYARDNADGSTTVYVDGGTCAGATDIWSVEV